MRYRKIQITIAEHPAHVGGIDARIEIWADEAEPYLETATEFWMSSPDDNARHCAAWVERHVQYLTGARATLTPELSRDR